MDFNFPTLTKVPLLKFAYSGNMSNSQKQFEHELKKVFKETHKPNKFYLIHFTPTHIEADEFNDDSCFIISMDLLAEIYYDPALNPVIVYTKFTKTNFINHLQNIR